MPTRIEWADETWNPITGCTPVSEGCANCYAKRMARRLRGRYGYAFFDPFATTVHATKFDQPLRWRKPRRVFMCSMGDLFHEQVLYDDIRQLMRTIEVTPQHTYIVLTKRPNRMYAFYKWATETGHLPVIGPDEVLFDNLWVGITAENQWRGAARIGWLWMTPAPVHFVSCEPLLGPIDLSHYLHAGWLNWVIAGAETGPGARPMHPDWARSLRDQCKEAGVPFFMKRLSGGEEPPPDLMVREWPQIEGPTDGEWREEESENANLS